MLLAARADDPPSLALLLSNDNPTSKCLCLFRRSCPITHNARNRMRRRKGSSGKALGSTVWCPEFVLRACGPMLARSPETHTQDPKVIRSGDRCARPRMAPNRPKPGQESKLGRHWRSSAPNRPISANFGRSWPRSAPLRSRPTMCRLWAQVPRFRGNFGRAWWMSVPNRPTSEL